MKKTITILAFWISIKIFAQVPGEFNRAYNAIWGNVSPALVEIGGSTYFNSNTGFGAKNYLYKHNYKGDLKLTKQLPFEPVIMYQTNDNQLLAVGKQYTCGLFSSKQPNVVCKIDTLGSQVFYSSYIDIWGNDFRASLQYTDSSYFSFTDSALCKTSKTGQFVSKTNLGLSYISSALLLPDNTILLSARQNSVISLVVISASGSIISSVPFPFLIKKMSFYDSQKIIGLGTNGKFYKISPGLNLIAASTFSAGFIVNDFACRNDSLYSIVRTGSDTVSYMLADTSFNQLNFSTTTTKGIDQRAICLNQNKVSIVSGGIARYNLGGLEYTHYFASLSQIAKPGSNNFIHDVAVESVEKDSAYAYFGISGPSMMLRAKVKVKNKGNTVITSFHLNCFKKPNIECGATYYLQVFDQLNMMPGDSMLITTPFIEKLTSGGSANYCFYTSLPNKETDKVFGNNMFCQTFTATTVSVDELTQSAHNCKIYPNPFNDQIHITAQQNKPVKHAEIYDVSGKLVLSFTGENTGEMALNTSALQPGFYLVKLFNRQDQVQVFKVVKQ